jgi:hypothetical protein
MVWFVVIGQVFMKTNPEMTWIRYAASEYDGLPATGGSGGEGGPCDTSWLRYTARTYCLTIATMLRISPL